MANIFDQFETLIREYISPSVINLVFEDDDVMWNLLGTMPAETIGGRTRGKQISATPTYDFSPAGYEAKYEIQVQLGGRVAGGRIGSQSVQTVGKNNHLIAGQGANAKYLDPRKTPLRSYIEIGMQLARIKGSVTGTREQWVADMASKPLEEVAGGWVADATKRLRSYITNASYGDGTASIAQVSGAYSIPDATVTPEGLEVTFLTGGTGSGTFARFMKGDRLVAGSNAEPRVQRAGAIAGEMVVVNVDVDNRTIWLVAAPGEGTISLSDSDHLMYADTYDFTQTTHALASMMPQGTESLLRTSGVYPGTLSLQYPTGLDVTYHSELKSFISDNTSTPVNPDMATIAKVLDRMKDASKPLPPVWISERSVWTLFSNLERENQSMVMAPMGQIFQAAPGVTGPVLGHMEDRFQKMNSARIRPNSILGLQPSTFKKYVPMGDRVVHWVYGNGPLSGFPSIFGPTFDGVQLLELVDAPFDAYFQLGCFDPRQNFRFMGVRAQRDV